MRGVVTRLVPNKGFGFVRDENGVSRFMHCRDVIDPMGFDTMREGMTVQFDPVTEGSKGNGLRAKNVVVLDND